MERDKYWFQRKNIGLYIRDVKDSIIFMRKENFDEFPDGDTKDKINEQCEIIIKAADRINKLRKKIK